MYRTLLSVGRAASRGAVAAATLVAAALGGTPTTTQAADGVLYAANPALGVTQLTLPSPIWLPGAKGGHLWVGDNLQTFCRLDQDASGLFSVNASTCNTTAKAPAQSVLDPRPNADGTRYVYIADDSTQSQGVVRVTYSPATETLAATGGTVLGDGGTAGRTSSIAFNPADGKLYVSHDRTGSIFRITNPNGAPGTQVTEIVGRTSDGRGVRGGMTFVCGKTCDLYIGESGGNGVTIIPDAQACDPFGVGGGCQATPTSITTNQPGGLTSDGQQYLFVGDSPLTNTGTILRYNVATDTQDVVSSRVPTYTASFPTTQPQSTYTGISGMALDGAGNLFVGDDPTLNAAAPVPTQRGKLWKLAGVATSTTACGGTTTTGCLDALGAPGSPAQIPPPAALAGTAKLIAFGQTAPSGVVWMAGDLGGHYWVSDHTQGLCRLDPAPDHPEQFATNPAACDIGGVIGSPGQPVFDSQHNFVFVGDAAVKSPGLWRLSYDPHTETISNPTLLAPGAGLDNDKLDGVAMGPDGNLYAAGLKNGFVYRIQNAQGDPTSMAVDVVGMTSDGRGINGSIGFIGGDLYLPENRGVSVIKNVAGCATSGNGFAPCTATIVPIPGVVFASSVGTDQAHGAVYVGVASGAANATIYRYTPSNGAAAIYATRGQLPTGMTASYVEDCTLTCTRPADPGVPADGVVGFHFPLGLFVDPNNGNLLLGEDIMAGVRGFHGHVWSIPYTQ